MPGLLVHELVGGHFLPLGGLWGDVSGSCHGRAGVAPESCGEMQCGSNEEPLGAWIPCGRHQVEAERVQGICSATRAEEARQPCPCRRISSESPSFNASALVWWMAGNRFHWLNADESCARYCPALSSEKVLVSQSCTCAWIRADGCERCRDRIDGGACRYSTARAGGGPSFIPRYSCVGSGQICRASEEERNQGEGRQRLELAVLVPWCAATAILGVVVKSLLGPSCVSKRRSVFKVSRREVLPKVSRDLSRGIKRHYICFLRSCRTNACFLSPRIYACTVLPIIAFWIF